MEAEKLFTMVKRLSKKIRKKMNFLENRYNFLLITILLMFFSEMFVGYTNFPLMAVIFLIMMIAVLRTLDLGKRVFKFCFSLACVAFVLHFITLIKMNSGERPVSMLILLSLGVYFVLIVITLKVFITNMVKESKVTTDTVRGGISIYLLLGMLWTILYYGIYVVSPETLILRDPVKGLGGMMYFSFTTLTTLGYGDIVPASSFMRSLTVLEAVTGQIFLATFVARLVGLHIAHSSRQKGDQDEWN